MSTLSTLIHVIALLVVVVMAFNIIIFVHELGHFLAAKWRGLQVDRFQIWFGKPIWKKTVNGVQYGLGWIPAGGFVALPQMAPMEAIEGGEKPSKPLPPISPLDKIIVAFAGPLFSMLLALVSACFVWGIGKPKDVIPTQIIGAVLADSPAEKAGLRSGDKITHINDHPVKSYAGTLDSIMENIVLSKGDRIKFVIERKGEPKPLEIVSEFKTQKHKWWQRGGLRQVGISPEIDHIEIGNISEGSPAEKAGLQDGDVLVSMNGQKMVTEDAAVAFVKQIGEKPIELEILRNKQPLKITATPQVPQSPAGKGPMLGLAFQGVPYINEEIEHPTPLTQIFGSLRMMWTTINRVIAPDSSIGVGHLSGPIGIGSMMFQLLQMDEGWRLVLGFMVLFNVNLAVLNMMPFPVLDGGHITLAILEKICGRPVKAKPLEILQTVCALLLMSLMVFVSTKDIGDKIPSGSDAEKIVFPAN